MDPKSQDEECHSSESGWTMYIGSPSNGEEDEMNCEDDFDEDDDDVGRGRRKNTDDDDNNDTDDSMASDASSGPSHHIIRNANKNPIPKEKGNGKSGSNNKASMKKGSLKNQDKGGYSVFSAKGAKVPSNGEKAWAFEVIPYLRQQVKYQEGVSCPRILRWLSAKTDKSAKKIHLFNPQKDANKNRIVWSNNHYKKIILEGGLVVVVDGLSGDGAGGGGSGAAVGANDAPLTVFKANHYEYDHTVYTDFASPSECSACKCQDCRAKRDVVINIINALTASVKKLTSKRGLILSKRILFSSAPLEIRAKRRRGVISRTLSSIQKSEIATLLSVCCTEQRTISKEEQHELKKELGGYDYLDWYEERYLSQVNRVIWSLLNKFKASEEKQNRARKYYIIVVIATGLVLLGTWIFKPNS
ncbi:hypothetical protein CQW23_11946 [Capsicum baccatum]|uniref:Uncharacterized protein n=1 Tax=Capsicum baccatum TaxID=33114 RepID=A0A2G2WR62_CAPBA|nr:hypothetical protein CQW23_11946 [Capsicum baccatum]